MTKLIFTKFQQVCSNQSLVPQLVQSGKKLVTLALLISHSLFSYASSEARSMVDTPDAKENFLQQRIPVEKIIEIYAKFKSDLVEGNLKKEIAISYVLTIINDIIEKELSLELENNIKPDEITAKLKEIQNELALGLDRNCKEVPENQDKEFFLLICDAFKVKAN